MNIAASAQALITLGSPMIDPLLLHQLSKLTTLSAPTSAKLASSKTLTANMSKRKLGIDSDDQMSMLVSSMTEANVAELRHVQDGLPVDSFLTPVLESIRQAYEATALPPPKTPVKVRN